MIEVIFNNFALFLYTLKFCMEHNLLNYFSIPFQDHILIFSTILFVILLAPLIFNKLKIPHLIGLILAGLLLGPHGFGVLMHSDSILLFGKVGLVYIMLIAGLEISIHEMKKNSLKSIVFGLYTFIVPMILGYILGIYILEFSVLSSILLASLFASHTLITYPIVHKLGVTKNKAVSIALGGTFITDTLALLVLSVVVALSTSEVMGNFWSKLGISLVLFSITILFVLPIIMRWFFKKVEDGVSQFIFTLALTFFATFLSQIAGLDPIIGAFMAGIAFNKIIPKSSTLMNRIDFVGNSIFIPIFLISIGMLINLNVFFEDYNSLKVAGLMTFTAVFAKFLAALFTQKTFRLTNDERRIIFGLSNSQAAVTLAAVMIGYNVILGFDEFGNPLRLLNDDVLNGSIIMILISCTISSFSTQKGASNIAINEMTKISSEDTEYEEKILIPIDNENLAEDTINLCLSLKTPYNKNNIYALTTIKSQTRDVIAEKKASFIHEKAHNEIITNEIHLNKLIRYNVNFPASIKNVINEFNITDVIYGICSKKNLIHHNFTTLTTQINENLNVTNFIYQSTQPISSIKKFAVIVPDKAEKEIGFVFWLIKIWNISKNIGAKIVFYSSENTLKYIKIANIKHSINADFKVVYDFPSLYEKFKNTKNDECIVFVLDRNENSILNNQNSDLSNLISQLSGSKTLLLIFPTQIKDENDPLSPYNSKVFSNLIANLEKLDDFGKNIANIFKRNVK